MSTESLIKHAKEFESIVEVVDGKPVIKDDPEALAKFMKFYQCLHDDKGSSRERSSDTVLEVQLEIELESSIRENSREIREIRKRIAAPMNSLLDLELVKGVTVVQHNLVNGDTDITKGSK